MELLFINYESLLVGVLIEIFFGSFVFLKVFTKHFEFFIKFAGNLSNQRSPLPGH